MKRKEAFVKRYGRYAIIQERATGFPAILILVHQALETGWGKHVPNNNLFGIKDTKWIIGDQDLETLEYVEDAAKKLKDEFEVFASPLESMIFYIGMIRNLERYKKAYEKAISGDYKGYFEELQKQGYATDPKYQRKLKTILRYFPKNWRQLQLEL